MTGAEPPRIEFPCRYPVKVMGENAPDFTRVVLQIGRRHVPELAPEHIRSRPSRNGRWLSLTLDIEARSESQLQALHADLKASGRVTLVL